jgi:hypothetical protein
MEEVMYKQTDGGEEGNFFPQVMEGYRALVVKGSPVLKWQAFRKWKDFDYFASLFPPVVKVHTPSEPVVRVHHKDMPFEEYANWTRPFVEQEVSMKQVLKGGQLVYAMFNGRENGKLLRDTDGSNLAIPWVQPLELNVWVGGASGLTTPCHFDMVHNMYAQIVGYKRFILFGPGDHFALYTFTRMHPSARQTQIDFRNYSRSKFPDFARAAPREVEYSFLKK